MSYYRKFILAVLLFINTSYVAQADEVKAGLPQLDFNTYPSLIFWSIVSLIIGFFFSVLYIYAKDWYEENLEKQLT